MLSTESPASPGPNHYIHTPAPRLKGLFPIVGRFQYLPGCCPRRSSLGGFLATYVTWGGREAERSGKRFRSRCALTFEGNMAVQEICIRNPIVNGRHQTAGNPIFIVNCDFFVNPAC